MSTQVKNRVESLRELDAMFRRAVNYFKYNAHNTDIHEDRKYLIFKQLRKEGHYVVTEAIFKNGKRADIIDLDDKKIIEICASEEL